MEDVSTFALTSLAQLFVIASQVSLSTELPSRDCLLIIMMITFDCYYRL